MIHIFVPFMSCIAFWKMLSTLEFKN